MAKKKTIVKQLNSIQNFGAMDILCTDKTGTLTQNKVILQRHLDIHGNSNQQVLEYAWLNSNHQTGLKNLLDIAILEYVAEEGINDEMKNYRKIDEIPFDFSRRRLSVVLRKDEGVDFLICKGAIEEVLSVCTYATNNGEKFPLTDIEKKRIHSVTRHLNQDGLRAIAIAYKTIPTKEHVYGMGDECELILAGYVAFLDPPKESAHKAISALTEHGVEVKIITGDNEVVTRKICKEVGLKVKGILLGKDIQDMPDDDLAKQAAECTIFAKMSPLQKAKIIKALKSKGHVVGYLGDGINDAIALKEADVGISVDTAVDVAKESANIILLEKSLMILEEGILEGRKIFANILKYVKMTSSSNFGNVFSVLIASVFLPFLPMLPLQLLIQNLLYDISQISIPWDCVDSDYLKRPRKWDTGGLARFMLFVGPISSIFDVITFFVMWHVFGANNIEHQALFHTGWFVIGLLTQTSIVHMIRTRYIPFIQSRASAPVIALTVAIMAIGIYLPFSVFGEHVGFVPLPDSYFYWLIIILLGYCALTQVVKEFYIRRFHQWL